MIKRWIFALALLSSGTAYADTEWVDVAASDEETYSAKLETFEIVTNKGGDEVVTAVGRVVSKKKNQTLVEKWYVRTSDCRMGYGKLVTLTVDGTFKYDNDFAKGSGNVGSGIAEDLCFFYDAVMKRREEQSI